MIVGSPVLTAGEWERRIAEKVAKEMNKWNIKGWRMIGDEGD